MAKIAPQTDASRGPEGLEWFWKELDEFLHQNQMKQTKQRKKIVYHFLKSGSHLSAEELAIELKDSGLAVGLATVYRTLSLLVEAKLVEPKNFEESRTIYEVAVPGEHHDHLVCTKCKKIIEFENSKIEKLQKSVAKEHGFTLAYHRLDLFGECPDCQ